MGFYGKAVWRASRFSATIDECRRNVRIKFVLMFANKSRMSVSDVFKLNVMMQLKFQNLHE